MINGVLGKVFISIFLVVAGFASYGVYFFLERWSHTLSLDDVVLCLVLLIVIEIVTMTVHVRVVWVNVSLDLDTCTKLHREFLC